MLEAPAVASAAPRSEALPPAVFDAIACGIVVHDSQAGILSVNRSARALLGLPHGDLSGQVGFGSHCQLFHEDGSPMPPAQQPSVTAAVTGQPVRDVVMGLRRDHKQSWLQVSAVPELNGLGQLQRVVVTILDITQRYAALEDHRRERALMEEVFRTVPTGIAIIDADGTICRTNAAAARLIGLSTHSEGEKAAPQSLPGQLSHLDGAPLAQQDRPSWRLFQTDHEFRDARFRWLGPSERRRVFSVNGTRLPSSEASTQRAVLTFQDITLQEAASRASRHARNRLDAALRAADLGRVDIHLESQRVSADSLWAREHGLPASWTECDLSRWVSHIDATDLERVRAEWAGHLKGEQATFDAAVWVSPPGRPRMRLQFTGQVDQRDEHGQATRMSGVLRNATREYAAREATQRMEENAAELARLEGTAAVAGGVAHTFSNLLGGVLGAVSSLEEQAQPSSPLAEGLSLIREASEHAGKLTTQLRGVSGNGRFRMRVAPLPQLVQEMHDLLSTALAGQAKVEVQHIGPPCSVKVDTDQLQQVAVNLVLNAAEADPRPNPSVLVRTRSITIGSDQRLEALATPRRPQAGRYALIEVIDRGCGMTEDVRRRMFEPFFSTRSGRAGLGLSAVLGITRGHGGHVAVKSTPGQGTTVMLILPETEEAPALTPPSPPRLVRPAPTRAPRVLVADDEHVIRRIVERVLGRAKYGVECVSDGQKALDVLSERRDQFDLLLVDLTMPGMTGHEVVALARAQWPDLPVVIMSGYTQREVAGQLASDTVGFLEKPFTAGQLRECIHQQLRGSRAMVG